MTWLPAASHFAAEIDGLFLVILCITGSMFVVGFLALTYALFRFRAARSIKPVYITGHWKWETGIAAFLLVVLTGLAWSSQQLWSRLRYPPQQADGSMEIEIFAQQYAWNLRYSGADKKLGRIINSAISDTNPFGLDPSDSASADDIVLLNEMHLPLNEPVTLRLRSKDVIHSFFVPEFRFKQDTIPGLTTSVSFIANRAGQYEIACAEYCGLAHYRMRGSVTVESKTNFDAWLRSQQVAGGTNASR